MIYIKKTEKLKPGCKVFLGSPSMKLEIVYGIIVDDNNSSEIWRLEPHYTILIFCEEDIFYFILQNLLKFYANLSSWLYSIFIKIPFFLYHII